MMPGRRNRRHRAGNRPTALVLGVGTAAGGALRAAPCDRGLASQTFS